MKKKRIVIPPEKRSGWRWVKKSWIKGYVIQWVQDGVELPIYREMRGYWGLLDYTRVENPTPPTDEEIADAKQRMEEEANG